MRHTDRVTRQQAETYLNTHFGHNIKSLEINYNNGLRIEYFANGINVGSFVEQFGRFEYLIN